MKKFKVIAIDGPAGSGKSTTARLLAEKLHFTYLDTGAMYRCVTLVALDRKIDLQNVDEVGRLAGTLEIDLIPDQELGNKVFANGQEVTTAIRTPLVDAMFHWFHRIKRSGRKWWRCKENLPRREMWWLKEETLLPLYFRMQT